LPVVTANATATTVCSGDSVTLSGSGADSYTWSGGVTDGVSFTPSSTDTYTVTGTDANGCMDTDAITITVNPLPLVVANATSSAVCDGDSVTLTGSGAVSYTWSGGVMDGMPFAPSSTDTYTVTGTDGTGCMNTDNITIIVNPLPLVVANATSSAVCDGDSVTLTGSGAVSYTWSGGVMDGVSFTPAATDTYTVTGTDANGCMNTDAITITVNPLPAVVAGASSTSICSGDLVTLTGSGAANYFWTGGVTDGVPFAPPVTTTYTVTGIDTNGCSNSDAVTIIVNPQPVIVATASDSTVCEGDAVTLTGSGGIFYSWSNGAMNGFPFSIFTSQTFTVTGTDANGCQGIDSVAIAVNNAPSVSLALPIDTACLLGGVITLSGETPPGGTWSGPGVSGNTFDPFIAGNGMWGIDYMFTDSIGCSSTATDSILVDPCTDIPSASSPGETVIYPNPTTGQFFIQLEMNLSSKVSVLVMNELGQTIQSFTMTETRREVDLANYAAGVYFVRIINDTQVNIYRVVKQ
ncbi:MAG TPA: T9SS type A sorting domain-containing protein, partial [Bacteroidia bacterium]|nr:T9SS type A sorting domain-containing protein [Bacteroidia bacterium]